ncbi:TraR/DksA family transcriptional regulator [uncultured Arthrobacter sp.]
MEEGRYGTCEVCGGRIADGRLEARPWTRFCIDHAGGA